MAGGARGPDRRFQGDGGVEPGRRAMGAATAARDGSRHRCARWEPPPPPSRSFAPRHASNTDSRAPVLAGCGRQSTIFGPYCPRGGSPARSHHPPAAVGPRPRAPERLPVIGGFDAPRGASPDAGRRACGRRRGPACAAGHRPRAARRPSGARIVVDEAATRTRSLPPTGTCWRARLRPRRRWPPKRPWSGPRFPQGDGVASTGER
jgi:hypothetical protein